MRIRLEHYIHDTGFKIWGGDIFEGFSRNSFLCPGYNTIASYIDKRLPAKARKAVEDHMSACKDCRMDVLEMRKMISYINEEYEMEARNVY